MDPKWFSRPLRMGEVTVSDEFWHREQELVRTEVIPYQWEALNDRVADAAPSYCMHNFRAAGRLMGRKRAEGASFVAPAYTYRGFEVLPEDPAHPDPDRFYGFVFQDTDFSKWIEAVGYSLISHPDPELERIADGAIDVVCAAQAENGYLDTYYIVNGMDRIFTNLKDHHELYCLGHLIEGAVSYYQATGKNKLLTAARRYADYVAECFGPEEGQRKGYPGHEIAEMALVRLAEATGEERYLELSRFFLDQRGTKPLYFEEEERERARGEGRPFRPDGGSYAYYQAHKPVRQQSEAVGHAVRAVYLYSGMADVARLTGDESLWEACGRLWDDIVSKKLYVTGGIGGTNVGEAFSYAYDLPNDTAYSETCAAIGLVFFARRMLQIAPKGEYGDVMERALYNTVLAGMALDGKSFFYVNPLEVEPEACHRDARKSHVKPVRQKWFGCACCPPNIARLVSSVAAYAYTENEHTLWTHLYIGGTVSKTVGIGAGAARTAAPEAEAAGTTAARARMSGELGSLTAETEKLDFMMETDFPWEGRVRVSVHADAPAVCTLAYRIPGWSRKGSACIRTADGERSLRWENQVLSEEGRELVSEKLIFLQDGYLYLTKEWQDGDVVELHFSMEVRMLAAHGNVREDMGKVAFTRGPITYCMEEADNGKNLHLYRADYEKIGRNCEGILVEKTETPGHPMAVLKVPAKKRDTDGAEKKLYADYEPPIEEPAVLTFLPYYAWGNRGEGEMSVWLRI